MRRLLKSCPACGGDLIVTEQSCTVCDTVIRGRYTGCAFCDLPDEDLRFVELFVTCRGNIKEMERETGLGYWTIRNRLDDVVGAVEQALERRKPSAPDSVPEAGDVAVQRRAILEAVERGTLSLVEAEQRLAQLGRQT